MSKCIRPKIPGARVFFTVNLVDRGADTLVAHVEVLRQAVAVTRDKRPLRIDAWVILSDHMHAVWTLPKGDADYATWMASINAQFRRDVPGVGVHADTCATKCIRWACAPGWGI